MTSWVRSRARSRSSTTRSRTRWARTTRRCRIIITTQAPTDADLLSVLIDDAQKGTDPRVVLSLYTADMDIDPFSVKAIKQANPAYGDFLNAKEIRDQAEKARRMPSQEALYRNYTLNQRVEVSSPFVSRVGVAGVQGRGCRTSAACRSTAASTCSETTDLTALVLVAPVDGVWHVRPTFWLPTRGPARARPQRPGAIRRVAQGRAPADIAGPQRRVPVGCRVPARPVRPIRHPQHRVRSLELAAPEAVAAEAGFSEAEVTPGQPGAKFVEFGQGFASMSPALRETESAILNGRLVHGNHPVLNMCMGNAVVQSDPAGNRKLTKAKSHGRIDGAVALLMAMSIAAQHIDAPEEYVEGRLVAA